jgi:hypothetical protein
MSSSPAPVVKKNVIVDQGVNKYSSLDIFEMTTNINELAKEPINSEFFYFEMALGGCKRYTY